MYQSKDYQKTKAFARYLAYNNRRVCCKGVYGVYTQNPFYSHRNETISATSKTCGCAANTHHVTSQWWTAIVALILLSETNKFEFDYLQLMLPFESNRFSAHYQLTRIYCIIRRWKWWREKRAHKSRQQQKHGNDRESLFWFLVSFSFHFKPFIGFERAKKNHRPSLSPSSSMLSSGELYLVMFATSFTHSMWCT